ncbi:hypothetical protein HPB52_017985 [Rhipicephalus sanguineus]|uniref:Uncharacterized protein n=1 Tax=Rhipicephalus sanguineus TaxID=34632 RepID=A0A9D4PJD2_RHISA|nr:hypothetical protein HPB52_017985 [Rhipicephalus sanguineus]
MESLSAESKQAWISAFPGRVDSFFGAHAAEHFPFRCAAKNPTARRNDQVCLINDYLPICNELLYDIGMELRQQRGGSLSLVCFRPEQPDVMPPPDADLDRSNTFLRWLLRIHVCIDGLKLQYNWVTAHSEVFLQELPENCRLKKLRVQFPFGDAVQTHFATLLPRLRCLEELYCYMSPSTDVLVAAVSEVLRTATRLTSLIFYACFENSQPPKIFIDALAANTILKSLEMWANWNTDELPGTLGEYVRGNGLLTKLVLFGEETDREELRLDVALVSNGTLSELDICRLCGGERTVRFFTRILAECTALKKLTLRGLLDEYVNISEVTMTRCTEALAVNEILEELTLPYSLWHSSNWITFFAFLPRNKYLKKLQVSNMSSRHYETDPTVLEALAQTDSSGRVSFGCYTHRTEDEGLMRFRAFSEINIYGDTSSKVSALQRLPWLDHFTSVTIGLFEPDERLFYLAANYIRATTVLRKLRLLVTNAAEDAPSSCWTLLFESIAANTSIADLFVSASDNFSYTGRLASIVGLSRCITRVYYSKILSEWDPTSFIMPLSGVICDNYNLLEVDLSSNAKVGAEARHWWFTIRETTRRNSGLVELAGSFNQTTAIDWYTANALEKVSRHPALVRELVEKEGIAADEVTTILRSRLRSVEGLHDFMRLTGVVKKRVTCAPPVDDCSVQLQDLNAYCWRIVRRYLSFDDVKRFTVGKPYDSTLSRTT